MKEKFIKSTLILMIGGFLTKILGMIIKIVMTRLMGTKGIGLYMLILPTFTLLIGLAQCGFPIAISKLVAEEKRNNKRLISSLIPISMFINTLIIIIILLISPFLSTVLLHENRVTYALFAMALVIPFTSLSGMLRSYFFGKNKMLPHVISNLTEDIIRLILIILFVPIFLKKGLDIAIAFIILSNIISELSSIIVLIFFIPKNAKISKSDLIPSKHYIKDTLEISIPNTTSRLISSIGYFMEPIIITTVLGFTGYSNNFIIKEYGIITGYVLPIVLLPSFFTLAISQALLPIVSLEYSKGHISYVRKKVKQAITFSLLIAIPCTILFLFFPNLFLNLVYNTNKGINYLLILAPISIMQYIQAPLSFTLDAMGKSKDNLKITILSVFVRTILLFLLSTLHIGLYSLIFATSINIIITTLYTIKKVKKYI